MLEKDDVQQETKHYTVVLEQMALAGAKVLVWLLLALLMFWYFWFKYHRITEMVPPEAYEYAQLARNDLRGDWFQTDLIRPVSLWLSPDVAKHPDLFHPPAYPVVLAGLMEIGGVKDRTMLWGSGLFFFLLMPVLYFAARGLFDRRTARLSLFFCLIMPAIGIAAVSGTPALLATFLVTSLFALLSAIRPRRVLLTVLAGAVLGACALVATRYVLLVIPAAGYLIVTLWRRAWVHVPILVVVAFLVVLPWGRRNVQLSGSPWAPMEWTSSYQLSEVSQKRALSEMRPTLAASPPIENSFSPDALAVSLWGREGLRALGRNLRLAMGDLIRFGAQSALVIVCIVGVLVRTRRPHADWLRIALYVAIGIELIYGAVTRPDSFLLLPFVPFMIVIGVSTLLELIGRLDYVRPISRFALVAAAIVVGLLQMLVATNPSPALAAAEVDAFKTRYALQHIAAQDYLEPDAVVLSNVPWHTAWYLDRPSIWLPPSYDDVVRLRMETNNKITFTFIAGYALNEDDPSYATWKESLTEGKMPDSFGLVHFISTVLAGKDLYVSFIAPERLAELRKRYQQARERSEPGDE
jgi:4-amino-4-deoxy-L-arabinose transferase-like glycosyltransferase